MRRRAFYSKFLKSGLKDFFSFILKITIFILAIELSFNCKKPKKF